MTEQASKLLLYIDMASQPSRAVLAFCRLNKIPHDTKIVAIRKGEHLEKSFRKINPSMKVPVIQEINPQTNEAVFTLGESHAILRYLAKKFECAEHWYP